MLLPPSAIVAPWLPNPEDETSMTPSTVTNVLSEEWCINDEVIRLRQWGTDRVFPLFADRREPVTIGTAVSCSIRVHDPMRRASREHAHLERIGGRWGVFDRRSKNGLYRDGAKVDKFALAPGVEIGLGGGAVLVAESVRWIALRGVVARMLGWSGERAEEVDRALREVRLAATRRTTLVLCGEEDLVPLAEELHRATFTAARPFVLCNPSRSTNQTPENPTRCVTSGRAAVAEAPGGTVCLLHKNLPADLEEMLHDLRASECQTQLVVCAASIRDVGPFASSPIAVPPLTSRKAEMDQIIKEYAIEAAAAMGIGEHWLSPAERAWIRDRCGDSLPDIQKATLRLAAIRQAGSSSAGALRLGISHTAMLKWLRNHEYPDIALLRASSHVPGTSST
jgi:hypothetical protein